MTEIYRTWFDEQHGVGICEAIDKGRCYIGIDFSARGSEALVTYLPPPGIPQETLDLIAQAAKEVAGTTKLPLIMPDDERARIVTANRSTLKSFHHAGMKAGKTYLAMMQEACPDMPDTPLSSRGDE